MNKRPRLQNMEEENKKAPAAIEPIFQNSPLFDPELRDVVPNIINYLDPLSFAIVARTCKEMTYICFNNNNKIKIPCWDRDSSIGHATVTLGQNETNFVLFTSKHNRRYAADSDFVKKLSLMPFVYKVGLEIWNTIDDRVLKELRDYFSNFPRVVVGQIQILNLVNDWERLVEFMKDYRVDALCVPVNFSNITYILPSREVLSFITQYLSDLTIGGYIIPDDMIIRATAKNLQIRQARISKKTFKELIKKFAADDILNWRIGREPFIEDDEDSDDDDDIEDEEVNEGEPDPFIAAVSEVMKVVKVEDINRNAMEHSTAYFISSEPKQFYILKSDGTLGNFMVMSDEVEFGDDHN